MAKASESYKRIWVMLFLGWTFAYIDRTLTGPVVTWMIQNKVGFMASATTPHALGGLLGSLFFAGYMLTQFPGGYFGDKFGHRTIIVISITWAGVVTFLTGLTGGLVLAPRLTRLVATALTAVAASDFLQMGYAVAQQAAEGGHHSEK